jgi:hypothetical protein
MEVGGSPGAQAASDKTNNIERIKTLLILTPSGLIDACLLINVPNKDVTTVKGI